MLNLLDITSEKVSVLQHDDIVSGWLHRLRGTHCLYNCQTEKCEKGKNLLHVIQIKEVTRPK